MTAPYTQEKEKSQTNVCRVESKFLCKYQLTVVMQRILHSRNLGNVDFCERNLTSWIIWSIIVWMKTFVKRFTFLYMNSTGGLGPIYRMVNWSSVPKLDGIICWLCKLWHTLGGLDNTGPVVITYIFPSSQVKALRLTVLETLPLAGRCTLFTNTVPNDIWGHWSFVR